MNLTNYTINTNLFQENIVNGLFAGQDIVISLIITFIAIVIITRNVAKWGIIAYPINLMFHKAGIASPIMIQLALGIWLIYTIMGTTGISRVVNSIGTSIKGTTETFTDAYQTITPKLQKRKRDKAMRLEYIKTGQLQDYSGGDFAYKQALSLGLTPKEAKEVALQAGGREGKQTQKLIETSQQANIWEQTKKRIGKATNTDILQNEINNLEKTIARSKDLDGETIEQLNYLEILKERMKKYKQKR